MDSIVSGVVVAIAALTLREVVAWLGKLRDNYSRNLGLLRALRTEVDINANLPPWAEVAVSRSVWDIVLRDGLAVPIDEPLKKELAHAYAFVELIRLLGQRGNMNGASNWYKDDRVAEALRSLVPRLDEAIGRYQKRPWWLPS